MAKGRVRGKNINARVLKRRQNEEAGGRGGQRPWREERRDWSVILLGRSHHRISEVGDTLTKVSHGVEISIAGGGVDEKDQHFPQVSLRGYITSRCSNY